LYGGLSQLAAGLKLTRAGSEHQAGSDALLTADAFFAMKTKFFDENISSEKFKDVIYGLS
jgi:CCR4-NOT transcription complex subunit 7/8